MNTQTDQAAQDYAQALADTAETLITAHRAADHDTYTAVLEGLTATQAQDVITAILTATFPKYLAN